jgi:archaellum component FlaF (FlaF/FlaG flagellin family)
MRWLLFVVLAVNLFGQDTVINKEKDQFTGYTWEIPRKDELLQTGFHVYFGIKDSTLDPLRAKVYYHGSDWIFFETMTVLVNGKSFNFTFDKFQRNEDVQYGVYETYDFPVKLFPTFEEMLVEICQTDTVKVRLSGEKQHDFVLTKKQISVIKKYYEEYGKLSTVYISSEKKESAKSDPTSPSVGSMVVIFLIAFLVLIGGTIYIVIQNAKKRKMERAILEHRYNQTMREKKENP